MAEAAPDAATLLAAARRLLPGTALVGAPFRIWRQHPAAEPPLLDLVAPAEGWACVAWSGAAAPLGLLELRADSVTAMATAEHPWLAHALLLGLAQASLPHAEGHYLGVFDAPGAGADRALVADCLDHELVVPLQPGAEVMHGLEFAAWLHRLATG